MAPFAGQQVAPSVDSARDRGLPKIRQSTDSLPILGRAGSQWSGSVNLLYLLLVVPLANPPNVVNQTDVDALWEFVQTITVARSMPPEVYFTREEEPPTSPPFLAYYYEHTRVLRISPLAVQKGAGLGYVYMVLGHEMLHYALAGQVPVEEHHCLFVQKGYRERIAEFLVEHGIAHPALRLMDEEVDGCDPSRVPGGGPVASDGPGLTGGP